MLQTKFHQDQPSGSWKEDFKCFIIYEHANHLGYVTSIKLMNFHFIVATSLHSKIALKLARWLPRKACLIVNCKRPWAEDEK